MMRTIVFFILAFSALIQAHAQQHFTAELRDASSGLPIAGATITVDGIRLGTVSDANGQFKLALPGDGPWTLQIRHVACESRKVDIKSGDFPQKQPLIIYLNLAPYMINPVVITSDRVHRKMADVPARMTVINATSISHSASNNVDELLKSVPGLYVNRSWGMYSRNASVTMRGLSSSSRVLVMLDDVPLNKSGGGGVNWNLLPNSAFEKIEVLKGPASSMYGNNAMSGTINLITRQNSDKASSEADFFLSQFNTYGFGLRASSAKKVKKPWAWISLSGTQGDGYYLDPEDLRNDYSSKCNLEQYNAYVKAGYMLSDSAAFEVSALASKFVSGLGTTVFETNGNFDDFTTWMGSMRYLKDNKNSSIKVIAFANYEDYFNQSESINSYSEYKLSENPTKKVDAGLWSTYSKNWNNHADLVAGIDLKLSIEDGKNLYLTASDEIYFFGMHHFAAAFMQYSKPFGKQWLLQTGLRYDFGQYSRGEIMVRNATALSDFLLPYSGQHPTSTWHSLSPKIAIKKVLSEKLNVYVSLARGFMPPTIDDMTRSGKIRKGIKIANPFLEPEVLYNAETGLQWQCGKHLTLEPSVYFSLANNMIYQVWTGDSVEILSDGPKPMIQKQNVTQGTVKGAEISLNYDPLKWLHVQMAYSFNHSVITQHEALEGDVNLSGLYMAEVPKHLFSSDLRLRYKDWSLNIEYRFTDMIFADDENLQVVEAFHLVNLFAGTRYNNMALGVSVNDLFDTQFIDRKGLLSPGRFVSARVSIKL